MSTPSDADLVEAYLDKRQDAAFVQLVRRYQIPVYRHLSQELADPDDAETVCEAVFVVAGRRLSEWPKDTEFRKWVLELSSEVSQSRRGEPIDSESPRLVDPAVFFRQSVHRALHSLEAEERSLLVDVELEGKSPEECAKERDWPLEKVTETLSKARTAFTATLSSPREEKEGEGSKKVVRVAPGSVIDNRYRVDELLGEGGMATVFRGEHLRIKRPVAVKTLRPNRQTQSMIQERFIREAEVLGRLAHPNFVDVSDFGESSEGFAYLVMELLEGQPLSEELRDVGRMPPARALGILLEVARGLAFAHDKGIIHRDIKPDNVVLLADQSGPGFAKILDLGIATTTDEDESGDAALYGTPAYMAPEQIQGGRIDGRVDIYSSGIMLYELLTGEVPFRGATIQYVLVQQLTATPPPLTKVLGEEVDERVQGLLDRCIAKDPNERFRSASALIEAIEELLDSLGGFAPQTGLEGVRRARSPRGTSPSNGPSAKTGDRRWLLGLGLVVGVAVALYFAFVAR